MESKALVKSTNINVACRFFARTPSRILRMVKRERERERERERVSEVALNPVH